jgi:transcriptional regulator with XRE-family HTH domain
MTQEQLADLLGVSVALITHIETGKRLVTPENAIVWEKKTGISRVRLCPEIFGASV